MNVACIIQFVVFALVTKKSNVERSVINPPTHTHTHTNKRQDKKIEKKGKRGKDQHWCQKTKAKQTMSHTHISPLQKAFHSKSRLWKQIKSIPTETTISGVDFISVDALAAIFASTRKDEICDLLTKIDHFSQNGLVMRSDAFAIISSGFGLFDRIQLRPQNIGNHCSVVYKMMPPSAHCDFDSNQIDWCNNQKAWECLQRCAFQIIRRLRPECDRVLEECMLLWNPASGPVLTDGWDMKTRLAKPADEKLGAHHFLWRKSQCFKVQHGRLFWLCPTSIDLRNEDEQNPMFVVTSSTLPTRFLHLNRILFGMRQLCGKLAVQIVTPEYVDFLNFDPHQQVIDNASQKHVPVMQLCDTDPSMLQLAYSSYYVPTQVQLMQPNGELQATNAPSALSIFKNETVHHDVDCLKSTLAQVGDGYDKDGKGLFVYPVLIKPIPTVHVESIASTDVVQPVESKTNDESKDE